MVIILAHAPRCSFKHPARGNWKPHQLAVCARKHGTTRFVITNAVTAFFEEDCAKLLIGLSAELCGALAAEASPRSGRSIVDRAPCTHNACLRAFGARRVLLLGSVLIATLASRWSGMIISSGSRHSCRICKNLTNSKYNLCNRPWSHSGLADVFTSYTKSTSSLTIKHLQHPCFDPNLNQQRSRYCPGPYIHHSLHRQLHLDKICPPSGPPYANHGSPRSQATCTALYATLSCKPIHPSAMTLWRQTSHRCPLPRR